MEFRILLDLYMLHLFSHLFLTMEFRILLDLYILHLFSHLFLIMEFRILLDCILAAANAAHISWFLIILYIIIKKTLLYIIIKKTSL